MRKKFPENAVEIVLATGMKICPVCEEKKPLSNTGIGCFGDDIQRMLVAIEYLEYWRKES